jgi:hypothetical protein
MPHHSSEIRGWGGEEQQQFALDPEWAGSAVVPATFDQYAVWLEGYLQNGGKITGIHMDAEDTVFNPSYWEDGALFAVDDFDLGSFEIWSGDERRILVADHVTWSGDIGINTLYLMDNFQTVGKGFHGVPIYPRREVRHLGPYIEIDFKMLLAHDIEFEGRREGIWGGVRRETDYREGLGAVLERYTKAADFFGIDVQDEEIEGFINRADTKRKELIAYHESGRADVDKMKTLKWMRKMEEG